MTTSLDLSDCLNPDHLRQMPDGGITPQPWMQLRQVATSGISAARTASYAVSGGGNKNDLLQNLAAKWTNNTPLPHYAYGLVTRGGCRVTLQAKSRAYLEQRHSWSAGPGPIEDVNTIRDILDSWAQGIFGPLPEWFVRIEDMVTRWLTPPKWLRRWFILPGWFWDDVEALQDMLNDWHAGLFTPKPLWVTALQRILGLFGVRPPGAPRDPETGQVLTSSHPGAGEWVQVTRSGTGADIGLGGMLALGTGFCVTEVRENSSTIPLMPSVATWPVVEPGEVFWGGVQLWFISEHWEANIIDGGSEGAESGYDTGETRLDLFAVPIITPPIINPDFEAPPPTFEVSP